MHTKQTSSPLSPWFSAVSPFLVGEKRETSEKPKPAEAAVLGKAHADGLQKLRLLIAELVKLGGAAQLRVSGGR